MTHRAIPAIALAIAVFCGAAQAQSQPLPTAFGDLTVTMQSRACGELLTGLAMGGVQALKSQQAQGSQAKAEAQRAAVYETGAQAVVLLTMAGSLSLDERLKAGTVVQAVEKMPPQVHVDVARFCIRRVEAWIGAGQVDKDLVTKSYAQSKVLLDSIFDARDPNAPR